MAWPKDRKSESRQQILNSAAQLFTAYGYERISIGDVMKAAGMTHGGFYSHFSSKTELYCEALLHAARLSKRSHWDEDKNRVFKNYLSMVHVKLEAPSCPLAFLSTDVASKEESIKEAYTGVFKHFVDLIDPENRPENKTKSYAISALMIGGVAIARALNDEALAQSVLYSCFEACKQISDDNE
ncbi:TetR/AcrR family transcriptional regulator [Vibrio salinus]|uniref:TetR/AcrR family transcriptional regulator n=1 Tax=Vibrio salinus TaxID=2899784 RepID=UPI001E49773D|nr:TetR/AcrR family transcriptional regulator [Vibrio salinus]MCE0495842.1 TetR/AcrR family transcriptional regulator [Vibrio salinus]